MEAAEYSEAFRSVLDSLVDRENVIESESHMDRLKADLYEFTQDEIEALIVSIGDVSAIKALQVVKDGDGDILDASDVYTALIFTVGVEIGRELERRVK